MPRPAPVHKSFTDRNSLYQEITDKIIAELQQGRVPWVQPWGNAGAPLGTPRNAATQRPYSGINILILWMACTERGFTGQNWLTFRQALKIGAHVRKGEKGTTVVYADRFVPYRERTRAAETGDEPEAIPFLKRFTVFNADQCEDLPGDIAPPPPLLAQHDNLVLPQAEALIRATGADIRIGGNRAFYVPSADYIQVPPPSSYFEPINWHRTVCHELGHWSGAEHRLRRDLSGGFGKLAPELLDAYRGGAIALEAVTAFTLGGDHAAQRAVWDQLKDQSYIAPYTVRRLLTQSAIPLDSDLGRFVGADAFEAAGGTITRDLFSGDDDGFMDDAALVRRLAIENLEAKAAELRPRWAWTRAVLDLEYGELVQYGRVRPRPAEIPADFAAEIERIEQRLGELEDVSEDDFTEELAAEAAQLEQRRTEIDDITDGLAVYADEDRARAGCIVTIGDDGEFCLHQGLVKRTAIRDPSGASDCEGEAEGDGEASMPPEAGDEYHRPAGRLTAEQKLRKECGFSQILVDDLKAHRLQITRAYLAGNFEPAFDLALYAVCTDLFRHVGYHTNPLELRATECAPRSSLNDLSGTPADRLLEAQRSALDLDWLQLPPSEAFSTLAALSIDAKQRLFAWCVASCLKPQLAIEDRADPAIECAGWRLAIPFADCWRPTAANYWGRVKKAHGLAIGAQLLGERWASDHAGDKKPVLAAALQNAFDPALSDSCIGLAQAARDNAAAWLPPGMAYDEKATVGDSAEADPGLGETNLPDGDAEDGSADLPAFLTEDEPAITALNGAAAH